MQGAYKKIREHGGLTLSDEVTINDECEILREYEDFFLSCNFS